ncbi:magnesium chelatase, partial [Myxococcota bacterium]|nr:magnesium chelatase [Myxococcota bacterium]
MAEIVAEVTFQARNSPDVCQASGVSVRMTIANYETMVANSVRRALRHGEAEAVPRVSDLDALASSTTGKVELEYAGAEMSDEELLRGLLRRASHRIFEEKTLDEMLTSVVDAFDSGWQVEVGSDLAAVDYLEGLDEIPGLRD